MTRAVMERRGASEGRDFGRPEQTRAVWLSLHLEYITRAASSVRHGKVQVWAMAEEKDQGKARRGRLGTSFNRIVRHFDQAIHMARFPTLSYVLIYEARVASWSEATRKRLDAAIPFRLAIKELAKKYRCDRNALRDRHRDLVAARVFIPTPDGRLRINHKRKPGWIDPVTKGPLFDSVRLAELDQMMEELRSQEGCAQTPPGGCVETPQGGVCGDTPPLQSGESRHPQGVCGDTPKGCVETPPAYIARAPGELEQSNTKKPTLPSQETKAAATSGGLVGGLVSQDGVPDKSTDSYPIPPGLLAIAERSARIPALYNVSFGPKLRTAWLTDGRVNAWWQDHPDSPAWSEALNELAGVDAEKRHVGMYLSIVRRLARKAAAENLARPKSPPVVYHVATRRRGTVPPAGPNGQGGPP